MHSNHNPLNITKSLKKVQPLHLFLREYHLCKRHFHIRKRCAFITQRLHDVANLKYMMLLLNSIVGFCVNVAADIDEDLTTINTAAIQFKRQLNCLLIWYCKCWGLTVLHHCWAHFCALLFIFF